MSARALNAILPQIASSPYEAHQKARTFASRYVKASQYDTAIDVLFQSARELLKTGQAGSGVDLASFLLDVYDTKEEPVTDESRERLTQLIALTGPSGSWRKTVIDRSIAWSMKYGECPTGDQGLHHYIGELLFKEGAFEAAEPHFLASGKRDSARSLAEMFVAWSAAGGIPGAYALRGTLPYLQNGNILAARTFINHFASAISKDSEAPRVSVGPKDEVIMTKDSIVNFCQIAVLTCQRAQGEKNKVMKESWVRLCGTYQSHGGLLTAPEVRRVLSEIAELYFAISPPRPQAGNPFGDMMASLLGGGGPAAAPARRTLTPGSATALD